MSEYDAVKHNSSPTEQEIRKLNSFQYGRNPEWLVNEMLKQFGYVSENGHSNINTLINQNEIKPNALMETSIAYKDPNSILPDNDTLLQDIIDLVLKGDTKGLGDRLPSAKESGHHEGRRGFPNALMRLLLTGKAGRPELDPKYLVDPEPLQSIPEDEYNKWLNNK
tara:strand:- start:744 stop:1241 length:498 start_codon:yes stop_codon:yes gene_type:complete